MKKKLVLWIQSQKKCLFFYISYIYYSIILCHYLKLVNIKLQIFSKAEQLTAPKTSQDEVSWNLVVSSSWQCVYWFNYLKVMPVFICLSHSLFLHNFPFVHWPTHISLLTSPVVSLTVCPSMSPCNKILFPSSYVDISHSLPHGLGSVCALPFRGAQLLCLPGASTGVKPL